MSRSGIFFKALANFQWDMMLEAEIVDEKYLRGCYLGQQYPIRVLVSFFSAKRSMIKHNKACYVQFCIDS